MRIRIAFLVVAVALVASACDTRPLPPEFVEASTTTTSLPGGPVSSTTQATLPPVEDRVVGTVTEVTDGDTLTMTVEGSTMVVRLLGINAPESDECWGPEATVNLSNLVMGQQLLLIEGDESVDSFGRSLRFLYAETPEGPLFINSLMVENGHAIAVQNGNDFQDSMKSLEARAFQSGRGMWGTFACGDDEGILRDRPVVRISEIVADPAGPDGDVLGQEYITILNEGYGRVWLGGWVIRDESSTNRFTIAARTVLAPGGSLTVVTGCDGGPSDSVHWCSDTPVWSNGGDTAMVLDTMGNAIIWHTYQDEG